MESKCYIVVFTDNSIIKLKGKITIGGNDLIICADCGYYTALHLGIKPDIVIGDFDSVDISKIPDDIEKIKFPSQKNETDTILAINEGIKRGYNDFIIIGGLSGRFDHSYANICALKYISDKGFKVKLIDFYCEVYYLSSKQFNLKVDRGDIISLFPFSKTAENISITGLKYTLKNADLYHSFPIGVSNEAIEDTISIEMEKGDLILIRYMKMDTF